ncbi:MAG TPA: D-glycero-beta-D-manno-heptose 1-phosphate adenylyltransferase [Pirellulales bacterium]|jgi:D-beta-D-heptose 7-phosphate kinase/D-beta-D-heptose 1-phosphate adenosyltransferase|nr:D-glycero-beta-D-manno-heptose 1-phosphate adenylyltransferase [Pirellulales bacterium]
MPSVRDFEGRVAALVFGDVMLDRRIAGQVDRISPEAPVPVLNVRQEYCCPGGAGHVAASLAGLGCQVTVAGVVGDDADGRTLQDLLRQNPLFKSELIVHDGATTICKTRLVAGAYQQLARLDREGPRELLTAGAERLVEPLFAQLARYGVVVIADYDKGTVSDDLARRLVGRCRELGVACLVDGKKHDFSTYAGATLLAPNLMEVERAVGRRVRGDAEIAAVAAELRQRLKLDYMVVTRGADGLTVASEDGTAHVAAEAREVADVTGAGDTVVAVLAACLAAGWPIEEACRLSVLAAGIAVSKPGTYVVHAAELDSVHRGASPKVVDWAGAKKLVENAQQHGKRVVFTNGCFDILHAGHLSCLERSRQLGDMLVVGLNSDASVRALKGPTRPVISHDHRAALLAGLACVDVVVIFEEERPEALVRHLAPDILAKGSDYTPEQIAGAEFVMSRGGKVVTLPLVRGLSTTGILDTQRGDARSDA